MRLSADSRPHHFASEKANRSTLSAPHRRSEGSHLSSVMVGLTHCFHVHGVHCVNNLHLNGNLAVLLRLIELVSDVGRHIRPTLLHLHLPIASRGALSLLTHERWYLMALVLPPVDHGVLGKDLSLVPEDELPVRANLGFSVADETILARVLRLGNVISRVVHDQRISNQSPADQHGQQTRVGATVVIPCVLIALGHALRKVDTVSEHGTRSFACVAQNETVLQDGHG